MMDHIAELPTLQPSDSICPFCGGGELRTKKVLPADAPGHRPFQIVECRDCVVAWQWPVVRNTDQSRAWFATAYSQNDARSSYFDTSVKTDIARLELDFLAQFCGAPGRLLDVGAGAGIFATEAAARGWTVTGIDPALPDEALRENSGLHLRRATIDTLPKDLLFDVITLWDVIEHLEEPMGVLREAVKRLAPGGWLVIETGNYQSVARISAEETWWCYQLDHRWYFAPPALGRLMKGFGLDETVLSRKVLRPGRSEESLYSGPSRLQHLEMWTRNPLKAFAVWQHYRSLRRSATDWAAWSNVEIIAMAGRTAKL